MTKMSPPAQTASMLPPLSCFNRSRPVGSRTDQSIQARLQQNSVEPGWRSHAAISRDNSRAAAPGPSPPSSSIPRLTPGRQREGGSGSGIGRLRSTGDGRGVASRGSRPGASSISTHATPGAVSSASIGSRERGGDVFVGGKVMRPHRILCR